MADEIFGKTIPFAKSLNSNRKRIFNYHKFNYTKPYKVSKAFQNTEMQHDTRANEAGCARFKETKAGFIENPSRDRHFGHWGTLPYTNMCSFILCELCFYKAFSCQFCQLFMYLDCGEPKVLSQNQNFQLFRPLQMLQSTKL